MRLINKYDLQDMTKNDLVIMAQEYDLDVGVDLGSLSYDELVDLINDSKKVSVVEL